MDIRSLHNSSNIHSSPDTENVCVCVCARVCVRVHARAQALSRVQLFVALWTIACQAPLSMEFFQARILEWSVLPFLSPEDLPDPGIEPMSLLSPAI